TRQFHLPARELSLLVAKPPQGRLHFRQSSQARYSVRHGGRLIISQRARCLAHRNGSYYNQLQIYRVPQTCVGCPTLLAHFARELALSAVEGVGILTFMSLHALVRAMISAT